MVDVRGDDRAAAGDFAADELGGDVVGDFGAEILAVADVVRNGVAADVFADGDIFHLGRDDAAARIVHLADVHAGFRAQHGLSHIGEGGNASVSRSRFGFACTAGATVGAELAVVLWPDFALGNLLDVAAGADPVAAQFGETLVDVDEDVGSV